MRPLLRLELDRRTDDEELNRGEVDVRRPNPPFPAARLVDRAWKDLCDAVGFFRGALILLELAVDLGETALFATELELADVNPEPLALLLTRLR